MSVERQYEERFTQVLVPLAAALCDQLTDDIGEIDRIDRISARAKDPAKFVAKSEKSVEGKLKYVDPLTQIQDQVGARIIVYYAQDVETVGAAIKEYYREIEEVTLIPESENEFGYEGKHFVLFLPENLLSPNWDTAMVPSFFELQIKTLFQHAWSEGSHDLAYKSGVTLSRQQKREFAFTAAQAWGADQLFSKLYDELTK